MLPPEITAVKLIVGLEVHIELSCATKVFSRSPSPAFAAYEHAGPNTCIDPVVLGLPGALPVLNRRAVELSIQVGLALNCQIAEQTRWDRKSYFYADMPKGVPDQPVRPAALFRRRVRPSPPAPVRPAEGWLDRRRSRDPSSPHRHHPRSSGGGRRETPARGAGRRRHRSLHRRPQPRGHRITRSRNPA